MYNKSYIYFGLRILAYQVIMNASYTFTITDFIPMFKDLYTDWFANKVNLDATQYLICEIIDTDTMVYNNELENESIDVRIGAIIAFDTIPHKSLHLLTDQDKFFKYSTLAAAIASSLFKHKLTFEEQSIIRAPFLHIQSTYTDIAIREQRHTHKIKINKANQWLKYSDVLQHIPSDPITFGIDNQHFVIKQFRKSLSKITHTNIIVSLSGSVESCVCLYIVKQLLPLHNIIAVYFGTSCDQKLKFVQKLCAVLNVKFYYRLLNGTDGTDGTDYSHKCQQAIRLDMYRKLDAKSIILLGNTIDDAFENIIKNISSQQSNNNLSNFDIITQDSKTGLTFFRPLLNIRKSEVLVFGISMNIPFLKCSTPFWSNRAKIRDVVLPALQNVNKSILQSFVSLKDYMQSADEIIEHIVNTSMLPYFNTTNINNITGVLPINHSITYNFVIWKKLFSKLLSSCHNVSDKSIMAFITVLRRVRKQSKFNTKDIQIVLSAMNKEYIMMQMEILK